MDPDTLIIGGLLLLVYAVRAATKGNPLPGYIIAVAAGCVAVYAMQEDYIRIFVLLAWAICATGILSAYVGRNVVRIRES